MSTAAQSQDKPADQKPPGQNGDAQKDQRKIDEFAEAARQLNGAAGHTECVYLGRLAIRLMSVDDLDTAFRHLSLYDRFGCPGGHIQAALRCLLLGPIDQKANNGADLTARVHACWVNPVSPAPAPTPAAASATPPTTNR